MSWPSEYMKQFKPAPGCPNGADKSPDRSWVCTDHMDYNGHVLHCAANSAQLCALWADDDAGVRHFLAINQPSRADGMADDWPTAFSQFDHKFGVIFAPVSDEEVQAAAAATAALYRQLLRDEALPVE
jgi:hypothetical protein